MVLKQTFKKKSKFHIYVTEEYKQQTVYSALADYKFYLFRV